MPLMIQQLVLLLYVLIYHLDITYIMVTTVQRRDKGLIFEY